MLFEEGARSLVRLVARHDVERHDGIAGSADLLQIADETLEDVERVREADVHRALRSVIAQPRPLPAREQQRRHFACTDDLFPRGKELLLPRLDLLRAHARDGSDLSFGRMAARFLRKDVPVDAFDLGEQALPLRFAQLAVIGEEVFLPMLAQELPCALQSIHSFFPLVRISPLL